MADEELTFLEREAILQTLAEHDPDSVLPAAPSESRGEKHYGKMRYKNRNVIERFFGALKRFCRIATRYEKKAANFTGFLWLAAYSLSLLNVRRP